MGMSDAFAEMMLGHLVCLIQCNAFILVEWAYLGRGKLRWPVLWAELLCMGEMGLSLAAGMSFFNVQSVLLNVLYLFVTAQLFGGNFADKLTACLINGTMCLLVENTVNYTYSWFTGVRTGEAWQHPGCLIALCAANLIVGAAVAHSLYSWNQKCALQPLQALVMSFFPGVAVVLNIVLMVTGTQQPATRMTMLLTFGMSVAVLVHIAIVQMFNDQVVQGQASHFQAALEQQRAEALMESYTAQRRLTHEFTNHIAALDALLRQGDLTGAQEYLSSVSKVVAAGTTILDTHNPLLDSLLSRKYEEAACVTSRTCPFAARTWSSSSPTCWTMPSGRRRRPNRRRCTCGRAGTRKNTSSRCATGCRRTWSWWMESCRVPPRQSRAMAWALSTCGRCWTAAAASTRSAAGTAGSALPVRCLPASCDSYRCRI